MHEKPRLFFFFILSCYIRHVAELIFYMEELRAHVRKYGPVMQRYYVQYLSGFDAVVLNELVQVRLCTMDPFPSYCTKRKDTDQLHFLMRAVVICSALMRWGSVICSWEAQTWTLVTLWIIHRISCRASRRTWGEIHKLHH